ncbi:MAG: non-hydrolyzing UDP-N-acetylglucosamine 2-epimerase, partial [Endomicrobiia bacterium]
MKKILCIFGTRPEAIKMAPVIKQLEKTRDLSVKVCITAQHRHMLDQVLEVFEIKPDYDLNIMQEGQSLYHVTCACLERLEKVLEKEKPDLALVHGDTTTTFASTLACFYKKIPVGHVEAGLRSFDKFNPYPEEVNRVLTDKLCDLLFAPTKIAKENLLKENIPFEKIFVTGNTVIDALFLALKKKHKFRNSFLKKKFDNIYNQVSSTRYILVTAHRRENFGKPIENICLALREIAEKFTGVEIIYPVHLNPNVQSVVKKILPNHPRIHLIEPLDYLDFINLMKISYIVVTDSGGLQEEAPALGKPVLVLRKVTERPEAVLAGTAKVVGIEKNRIFSSIKELLENKNVYNKMAK